MRRRALPFALSALLLVPVLPVAAVEPEPSTVVVEPSPSAEPTAEPTSAPSAEPTTEPSAAPTTEPSAEATNEPTEAPASEPTADPTAEAVPTWAPNTTGRTKLDASGRWIVILRDGVEVTNVRDRFERRSGLKAERLFQRAVRGFVGRMSGRQVADLRADRDVVAVIPDEVVEIAAQTVPTGVSRVGARASTSTVARIDGVDQRVDADVAIVDTGIDPNHPDLNVVGGYNCSTSDRDLWRDVQNHGTHVAGTVGAIDNGSGVVGVAPGVRLWAVKILNDDGYGYLSWYVCGLDWIAAQRDPNDDSRPLIEAVNMSVTKWGSDDNNCGQTNADILHQAICRVTSAGITVVAAAANDSGNASKRVPAAYDEVITVSALADGDGKPGGLRGTFNCNGGSWDNDDTFGNFSNYGADVDLMAPGKCIWSTLPGNRYGYSTGTSMAAPAVTGAVALFKASRPWASPGAVKNALQVLGSTNWSTSTDPDSTHEKLLDVSRLGPAGTFEVKLGTSAAAGEGGGSVKIPVTIDRSATHFETLRLSANAPAGFGVSLDRTTLSGFTATSATLTVTIPRATVPGSYPVTVIANEGYRWREATTTIVVESDLPTARPPVAVPAYKEAMGTTTAPLRVSWPAATDPSSAIAGYELQISTDSGPWSASVALGPTTTSTVRVVSVNHAHRFRIRARDTAGNWSPWATAAQVRLSARDDASSSVSRSAGWSRYKYQYSYAGTFSRTTRTGAWLRTTVSGKTLALVAPIGPRQGWVRVYVDGVYQGQVSLYSAKGATKRVLWVRTFASDGAKVVELRAVRTSTRSRVDIDALLMVR